MKNKLLLEIERQKKLMGINERTSILKESGPGNPYGWGGVLLKKLLSSSEPALTRIKSRFEDAYNGLRTKSSFDKLEQKGVRTFNELVDDTKKVNTGAAVKGSDDEYIAFAKDFILKIFKESKYQDIRETVLEQYKNIFAPNTRKALDDLEALAEAGEKEAFETARLQAERGGFFDPVILNYLETKLLKTKRDIFIDPKNSQIQDDAFRNYLQRLDPEDQKHVNMMIQHAKNGDYEAFFAQKNSLSQPLDPEMLRFIERNFKIDVSNDNFFSLLMTYFFKNDLLLSSTVGALYKKIAGNSKTKLDEIKIQFRNIIDEISDDIEKGNNIDLEKLNKLNKLSREISEFNRSQIKEFWDGTKNVMPTPFLKKLENPDGNFDENIFMEWIKFYESASGAGKQMLLPPKVVSKIDAFIRFWRGRGSENIKEVESSVRIKNRFMRLGMWARSGTFRLSKEIDANDKFYGGQPGWLLSSTKYRGYQLGELVMSTLIYAPLAIGFLESMLGLLDRKLTSIDIPFVDDEAWFGGEEVEFLDNPWPFIRTIWNDYMFKNFKFNRKDIMTSLSKGLSPGLYAILTNLEKGGTPEMTKENLMIAIKEAKVDTTEANRILMEKVPNYQQLADDTTTFKGYDGNIDSLLNHVLTR